MRKRIVDRTPYIIAVAAHAKPRRRIQFRPMRRLNGARQEGPAPVRLQQAISERAELQSALATSQQQLQAAREQIEALAKTNSRFRQRLTRLAQKTAEARHFAYHDELTGLPNRSLLLDRLKQAMVQAERQHKQVALLLLDLDGFKDVNDEFGHAAGDKLLQQVAERLAACVRGGDTVCRYGGDEFVVMLPEIDGQETAEAVAEKIRSNLAAPYVLDGNAIAITASVGVAMYRGDEQHHSDLIKQADIAMYLAKALNRHRAGALQHATQTNLGR